MIRQRPSTLMRGWFPVHSYARCRIHHRKGSFREDEVLLNFPRKKNRLKNQGKKRRRPVKTKRIRRSLKLKMQMKKQLTKTRRRPRQKMIRKKRKVMPSKLLMTRYGFLLGCCTMPSFRWHILFLSVSRVLLEDMSNGSFRCFYLLSVTCHMLIWIRVVF